MGRPKPIAEVLSQLLARRGYAREQSAGLSADAWRSVAGEALAPYTRAGAVRRGVLEVVVSNSTLVQELSFQKQVLVSKLAQLLPDEEIRDLRFRVGAVSD